MKRILFMINPGAGKGHTDTIKRFIHREMRKRGLDYDFFSHEDMNRAKEVVKAYAESYDIVVSVGGDGTNQFILECLMETNQRNLGILPTGTGNDFAKALGFKGSFPKSLRRILDGSPHPTDIGKVGNRYFLNTASMGFDVEVIETYDALPRPKLGSLSYLLSVFLNIFTYESKPFSLSTEGEEVKGEHLLFVCGNGRYYGGGMPIAPKADPSDGYLDLVRIHDISNKNVAKFLPKLARGRHLGIREFVDFRRVKKVTVDFENGELLNLDGELFPVESPLTIEVLPGEISLWY